MIDDQSEVVLDYYERALIKDGPPVYVNYYFDKNVEAHRKLVREGVIKEADYHGAPIGTEYKGHLFRVISGSGDCEEILVCLGELIKEE